jgi:hypothetical protein
VDPFAAPEAAAAALFGVQAQILPAAGVSLHNRVDEAMALTESRVDTLLNDQRSLVKLWGQRGTLHLYRAADWPLLHGARSGHRSWWTRRMEKEGRLEEFDATVRHVERILRNRPTLGRSALREADLSIDEQHLSPWGGVFAELVLRGRACHAGRSANEGLFAHRERWLPDLPWNPPRREVAGRQVARRYLGAYGPASAADLAYWFGGTVSESTAWIRGLGDAATRVHLGGQDVFALTADLDALQAEPPPRNRWPIRLLYRFDPLLLAHRDKTWLVSPRRYDAVWRPAGHIEPVILRSGRIAGTWRYDRGSSGLQITLRPFRAPGVRYRRQLERLAEGIAGFFEMPLSQVELEDG